jgi:hypothetical protein
MAGIRVAVAGVVLLLFVGFIRSRAQDGTPQAPQSVVAAPADPDCPYFSSERERVTSGTKLAQRQAGLTAVVAAQIFAHADATSANAVSMPSTPGGSRTGATAQPTDNTIDKFIFPALTQAGVAGAPPTTDYEFVRRVYLDLTGHIPTPVAVQNFIQDGAPDKRAKLVDSLIGSPAWIDKWTMWFGDFLQNNSRNTQIQRTIQGVMAFNTYVRSSLTNNKPYDQMAREIISAKGTDSFTQGEINYMVGGVVGGGPIQDIFDQQAANAATTFLGLSNLNCLLCHDGRGHLDALNLWGYSTTRKQAWGMASFMSHTSVSRPGGNGNAYQVQNTITKNYQLNTQTGNRPPRGATNSTVTVTPVYILNGGVPGQGEDYRTALARMITADFQFARATVNYVWEYFFNLGLVSPSNQFDPMRLDPNNPPSNCPSTTPCTLQASNPQLLNALAQDFINSGYDLKALQREIVNSQTYQLSSRYSGTWDPSTANLFGRHLVRRLWSEELHDAVVMSSGIIPTYNNAAWGPQSYAMKFPEPLNTPDGATGPVAQFLDFFLRGNRDDQPRRPDGSISQALGLMNDNFVMNRVQTTTGLLQSVLPLPDDQLVNGLFLTVLSRPPSTTEMSAALQNLKSNRTQEAQNLLWSLYNKVDFVFNY